MSERDIEEFNQHSEAEARSASNQHSKLRENESIKQYVEDNYLAYYEAQVEAGTLTKSTLNKKRSAWLIVAEYSDCGSGLIERPIGQIRPSDIDHFFSWTAAQTDKEGDPRWSESTLKSYFGIIRSIFKSAAQNVGASNPADPSRLKTQTIRIKGRKKTEKVVTKKDLKALEKGIEKAINKSKKHFLYCRIILRYLHPVLMGTGIRIGEALYLKDEHIDRENMTLTIEGSVVDRVPGPTKTGKILGDWEKGVRVIPMSAEVEKALSGWMRVREEYGYPPISECPTIFCSSDEKYEYLTDQQIRKYYKRASDDGKLSEKFTPQMSRHTFNDRLRRDGVPSEVREAILGHADGKINRNYTNPKAMEGREAVEALARGARAGIQ
jgi:integrase